MAEELLFGSKKNKRCLIYIRVSLAMQVEGYSLDAQENYLKQWCEREGMTVVGVYKDAGKSGKSIKGRDAFQKMLDDISQPDADIDYVVTFKLSRFGRNARDILNCLTTMQRYGTNLLCTDDGLDSSTAVGRLMVTIFAAVVEMERENIRSQSLLGRKEKARKGDWVGGQPPYGYELVGGKVVMNEEQAAVVRLIVEKYLNGEGIRQIVADLNTQGIEKPLTKALEKKGYTYTDWQVQHISRILKNPNYTGHVAYGRVKTEKIGGSDNEYHRIKSDDYIISDEISHEAIIDKDTFEKIQAKMNAKPNSWKGGRKPKYMLASLLRCPQCGGPMYSDVKHWATKKGEKKSKIFYSCGHTQRAIEGQCSKNLVEGELVEKTVVNFTKALVSNEQFANDIRKQVEQDIDVAAIDAGIENCRTKLKGLERSKANLERDIDAITDGDRHAARKRNDLNKRLDAIYDDMADVEAMIDGYEMKKLAASRGTLTQDAILGMLKEFDKFFDRMELAEKRRLLECLVEEVHLYPQEEWEERGNPVKEIVYAFPVSDEVMAAARNNLAAVNLSMGENSTAVKTVVTAIGAGIAVWGILNLLESYGNDNPGANAQVS